MRIKNLIKSPRKFDVTELIEFLAKELKIDEDIQLTIAYNEELLTKLSNEDIEYQAITYSPNNNLYYIFVTKTRLGLQDLLCHEMVHVSQCVRGDLKISNDYKTVT